MFVILPDGTEGSEIKARFTKAVQTQKLAGNKGCLVQCILTRNAFNKNAALGAFEDALAKCGNVLYELVPIIPKGSPYENKLNKIWTIGLDVSHNKEKPSTAMAVLQTLPFQGTHRGMRCVAHLNKPRTEVIPFAAMVTMTYECLMKEQAKIIETKTRPQILMVFRDGVPDNQLKEVYGKELVGILRGIRLARDALKRKGVKKWKLKLQFIVVSKSPIEKFGVRDDYNGNIVPLNFPAVVFRGITSNKLWDFFMWNYHYNKQQKIDNIKPLRYVVLKDELKLGEREGSNDPIGLYEIINCLFYSYCFAIPFQMGGTSQPGPIVYAKHYAETFAQMILQTDESLNTLKASKNLTSRPQIITKLLNLPDIVNGNGNGNGNGHSNGSKGKGNNGNGGKHQQDVEMKNDPNN